MAKVNYASSLVLYGKVPDVGWRRGSVVLTKTGEPKPSVMLISGRVVVAENLTYQIRTYVDRKAKYLTVGSDYGEAVLLLKREQLTRKRTAINAELGEGVAPPKSAEELAADTAAEQIEKQRSRKTLTQFADAYLTKKKKLGTDSIALYRDSIQPFIDFTGVAYMEELTGQMVADWYDSLRDAGYAQRTAQTRYVAVRGFLKRCGVNVTELIEDDTHKRLRKKPDPHTEPYSTEQIDRLLATADPYYRMVLLLLISTGLRMKEAMHLTWGQVQWDENKISVKAEQTIHHPTARVKGKRKVVTFTTKTGKGRTVPLFATLKVALKAWRESHPDTIYVVGTRSDLPNNHWLRYLKIIAKDAGLNCGTCATCAAKDECEQFYLHRARHTFAARCLDRFNLQQVSRWLGHHDASITASVYLSGTPAPADTASDPFAPRTGWVVPPA